MGRHTAPSRRSAQLNDPENTNDKKAPRSTSALPLAAVVLTGLASAAAAAAGTAQAADAAGPHVPSRQAMTQILALRGRPTAASRADRVDLGRPDVPPNLRTPAPRESSPPPTPTESSSPPASSAPADPVTATGQCVASYYDTGTTTANGEAFDTNQLTAASKTLPFGTQVRVIDDATKRSVVVRINDRGPYVTGRCLDLTPAAMRALAGPTIGTVHVTYQVLGRK